MSEPLPIGNYSATAEADRLEHRMQMAIRAADDVIATNIPSYRILLAAATEVCELDYVLRLGGPHLTWWAGPDGTIYGFDRS